MSFLALVHMSRSIFFLPFLFLTFSSFFFPFTYRCARGSVPPCFRGFGWMVSARVFSALLEARRTLLLVSSFVNYLLTKLVTEFRQPCQEPLHLSVPPPTSGLGCAPCTQLSPIWGASTHSLVRARVSDGTKSWLTRIRCRDGAGRRRFD